MTETTVGAYRRIAVPLDGTAESEQALPWAVTIAKRAGCPLDLTYVSVQPLLASELYGASPIDEGAVEDLRSTTLRRLRRVADDINRLGVQADANILDGAAPTTLAEHFHKTSPDLVVMTTHDPGRLEHMLVGSVATSVIRRSHIPVLLIRPQENGAALESSAEIGRILIPLDGSKFGAEIVPHASRLARVMAAEVTFISVLQPVLVATAALGAGSDPVVPLSKPPEGTRSDKTLPQLDAVAESLTRETKLAVHTAVLSDGDPSRAIVEYAHDHGIDVIAMTTHGRGALKRLVAGSVSAAVARSAHLPVLMFRPSTA